MLPDAEGTYSPGAAYLYRTVDAVGKLFHGRPTAPEGHRKCLLRGPVIAYSASNRTEGHNLSRQSCAQAASGAFQQHRSFVQRQKMSSWTILTQFGKCPYQNRPARSNVLLCCIEHGCVALQVLRHSEALCMYRLRSENPMNVEARVRCARKSRQHHGRAAFAYEHLPHFRNGEETTYGGETIPFQK